MLWTIIVILLILWLLGAFVRPFGGGLIHLLLVIVLILAILQLV
ncbi:MAG: lmo0937 family membrane protein [Gemmatimonadota bacterium]